MTNASFRVTICGLSELPLHYGAGVTHILSILDPEAPDPEPIYPPAEGLVLRFHDVDVPVAGAIAPDRAHVEALLAFGRRLPDDAHLLVHCHAGISRSTAAAAALLLQAHPETDEEELIARIAALRPQAWPNLRMMAFADALLGRRGRLLEAARRFCLRRIAANRSFGDPMPGAGESEDAESEPGED